MPSQLPPSRQEQRGRKTTAAGGASATGMDTGTGETAGAGPARRPGVRLRRPRVRVRPGVRLRPRHRRVRQRYRSLGIRHRQRLHRSVPIATRGPGADRSRCCAPARRAERITHTVPLRPSSSVSSSRFLPGCRVWGRAREVTCLKCRCAGYQLAARDDRAAPECPPGPAFCLTASPISCRYTMSDRRRFKQRMASL